MHFPTDMAVRTTTSRETRRAQTCEALLAAAQRVFARRGFHGASVDAVAEEAGLTSGALYSNFDGKEDLFLTLLERHIERQTRQVAASVAGLPTVEERAARAAEEYMRFLEESPELTLLFVEFWAYAAREPGAGARFAERTRGVRDAIERLIHEGVRELGVEPPLPVDQLAVAIAALADGLALHRITEPDAVPRDLYGEVLALILRPRR